MPALDVSQDVAAIDRLDAVKMALKVLRRSSGLRIVLVARYDDRHGRWTSGKATRTSVAGWGRSALGRMKLRLSWPWRRHRVRQARPAPTPPQRPPPGKADVVRRLAREPSLRGELDDATWQPLSTWLAWSVGRLAQRARAGSMPEGNVDQAYRALRETTLLLGDLLLAGTEIPDFAGSMESVEGYLAPWFPLQAEQLFPRLMQVAEDLHRRRASSQVAAQEIGRVLLTSFGGT